MIDLTEPQDFLAALDKLSSKEVSTALADPVERSRADAELLDRSFFASRVTNPALLQEFKDAVNQVVAGSSDESSQRLKMIEVTKRFGLEGLLTNARLQLILRTNTGLVQGYGQWQENNAVAETFPASELIRIGFRRVPRHWLTIWEEARQALGSRTTALPAAFGRLVALKTDPIWVEISDFGVPWPPFKWNSGMGTVNVSWDDALDLGLIEEGKTYGPATGFRMNTNLKASAAGISNDLLSTLATLSGIGLVGDEIVFDGFGSDGDLTNRSTKEVMEALCI